MMIPAVELRRRCGSERTLVTLWWEFWCLRGAGQSQAKMELGDQLRLGGFRQLRGLAALVVRWWGFGKGNQVWFSGFGRGWVERSRRWIDKGLALWRILCVRSHEFSHGLPASAWRSCGGRAVAMEELGLGEVQKWCLAVCGVPVRLSLNWRWWWFALMEADWLVEWVEKFFFSGDPSVKTFSVHGGGINDSMMLMWWSGDWPTLVIRSILCDFRRIRRWVCG